MPDWRPLNQPLYEHRKIRVICVGAGLSGMHFAALVREFGPGIDLQIYERNPDIGGTWYNNRYPGVACDVPSHAYSLSWAPFPDWSRFQAPGRETLDYCELVAKRSCVREYTRFRVNILSATWDGAAGKWKVEIKDLQTGEMFTDEAECFVNASGLLSTPKLPDVENLEGFKGKVLHTAEWDDKIDLNGKTVALVGAGSSSLQVLPMIQPNAKHVDQYIRSSTWVIPLFGNNTRAEFWQTDLVEGMISDDIALANPVYTEEHKEKFRKDPEFIAEHRRNETRELNGLFAVDVTWIDSPMSNQFAEIVTAQTKAKLNKKPELAEIFIPEWKIGCRRGTPSVGFLKAIQEDNVSVIRETVTKATEKGLIATDGKEREYDVVIYATGFDTTFKPPFKVTGTDGFTLDSREYTDNPSAYMVAHHHKLPNYFNVTGPLIASFNGGFLEGLEHTINYIFKTILKLQRERYKTVAVKQEAVEGMMAYADAYLPRTVHTQDCNAWYKANPDRKVRAIWPGSSYHLIQLLDNPRWEDFNWEQLDVDKHSKAARYAFLGHGKSHTEVDGGDLADYVPVVKDPYAPVPKYGEEGARKEYLSWGNVAVYQ